MQVCSKAGPKHVLMSCFDLFTLWYFCRQASRTDLKMLADS